MRERLAYRYLAALQDGDIEMVLDVLTKAERDAVLEEMLWHPPHLEKSGWLVPSRLFKTSGSHSLQFLAVSSIPGSRLPDRDFCEGRSRSSLFVPL
jgi:hypothetical protein